MNDKKSTQQSPKTPKYAIGHLTINIVYIVCSDTYVLITFTSLYITCAKNITELNKYKSIFTLASLIEKDNGPIYQRQENNIFHTMPQC